METLTTVTLVQRFLQESVFASRAATHAFSPRSLEGGATSGCGLGIRPAIPADFSEKQAQLLNELAAAARVDVDRLPYDEIRDQAAAWIKIQDGIDRERNHFLKDFRNTHGFERCSYSPEVEEAFKAGLAAINASNRQRLEAHAEALAGQLCVSQS